MNIIHSDKLCAISKKEKKLGESLSKEKSLASLKFKMLLDTNF